MTVGLDVRVGIKPTGHCPIVDISEEGLVADFVPGSGGGIPAQISVEAERAGEVDDWPHLSQTLQTTSHTYYRLSGFGQAIDDGDIGCSSCRNCAVTTCLLNRFPSLPADPYEVFWRERRLCLSFALRDRRELSALIESFRTGGYSIELQHLLHGDSEPGAESNVVLDLRTLTGRQRDALELAISGDYFGPEGSDALELADELGISPSTFSTHVRLAVRKLLCQLSDDG
ncbi:helix-turn-helix domain-containing protein (plasmid) [Haladaptatus sp. SPP-AMP-3]|uniref:helix-turn-helix domain-containing protein n=1 Tax=Haladaptatus sp. SPP-AMP-3 TaxID=3121295 RepID=UPI003C30339C